MTARFAFSPRLRRGAVALALIVSPMVPTLASVAHAHARVVSTTPADGGFLTTAPTSVTIRFSEEIRLTGSNISVIAPGGTEVNAARATFADGDRKTLSVPIQAGLINGLYSVNWVAISEQDGDTTEGAFNFGLRSGAAPPTMNVAEPVAQGGQTLTITGEGYKPRGAVVVSAGDDDAFVDSGTADASGRVALAVRLPEDLPFGKQAITLADGDGAKATQEVLVRWGGWPPVKVTVTAEAARDDMTFGVTIQNRSDYALRIDAVRLRLPDGTRFKRADGPGRLNSAGEATWDAIDLPAHHAIGPFNLLVDTTHLKDGVQVTDAAWVQYSHASETTADGTLLPSFTSNALSRGAAARVGGSR